MSIIYGTLERLEVESEGGENSVSREAGQPLPEQGSTIKRLGVVAVLALAGYGGWQHLDAEAIALAKVPRAALLESFYAPGGDAVGEQSWPQQVEKPAPSVQPAPEPVAGPTKTEPDEVVVEDLAPPEPVPDGEALVADSVPAPAAAQTPVELPMARTDADVSDDPAEVVMETGAVVPGTAPAVSAPQPDEVDTAVERARTALSVGDYSRALSELVSLPQVPADRADYWLVKGSAHLALGMLEPAEFSLGEAHALAPGNAQVAVQLAIVHQEKGDHQAALQILAEAAEKHTHVPELFLNMGYSQLALGAEPAARRSFRTFMQLTRNRSLYQQQRSALERWLQQASLAQR